jgi:hypothetical protein
MKQTAMQEHIEWLKSTLEICEEHATPLINCLKLCISDAEYKLKLEKEQIQNAFDEGDMIGRSAIIRELAPNDEVVLKYPEIEAEQYYNDTYKSE